MGVFLVGWGLESANKAWREWFPACCGTVPLLQVYIPQMIQTHFSSFLIQRLLVQAVRGFSPSAFALGQVLELIWDWTALPHPHFTSYCQSPRSILLDSEQWWHILWHPNGFNLGFMPSTVLEHLLSCERCYTQGCFPPAAGSWKHPASHTPFPSSVKPTPLQDLPTPEPSNDASTRFALGGRGRCRHSAIKSLLVQHGMLPSVYVGTCLAAVSGPFTTRDF